MMTTYWIHNILKRSVIFFAISLAVGVIFSAGLLGTETTDVLFHPTTVFIDPGHGGKDTGAQGANGLLEKDVTLALGKHIENRLEKKFTSRLSRNDDYGVELVRRIETANNQKADIFIGLHTGGAFNHNGAGISIYYFLDSPGRILPDGPEAGLSIDQTLVRIPWHSVQYRYAAESRILAEFLQAALAPPAGAPGCHITGAPLLVLSAADMPAVLIEIGCLNDPKEEAKLMNPDFLNILADAIGDGIESYLNRTPGITSIDLHQ